MSNSYIMETYVINENDWLLLAFTLRVWIDLICVTLSIELYNMYTWVKYLLYSSVDSFYLVDHLLMDHYTIKV